MIAITGAAGFIGSQLAAALKNDGKELLLVDHPVRPEKAANLEPLRDVSFMLHTEFAQRLERGKLSPDWVFHLGACSDTTEKNWQFLADNNLEYSKRIWNGCIRTGANLMYASSAATYGDGSKGFDDERIISDYEPLNLYARSKHEFDLWALSQAASGNPLPKKWIGLKFFNVFGPGESHKGRMASMVFHGFHQIVESGKLRLFQSHRPDFPDGGQLRDFIYVKDVLAVMKKLAWHSTANGIVNLGTGQARSFFDLAKATGEALGRPVEIEYIPMPSDLRGKYQYFTEAKMEKLERMGVRHEFKSLESAVADYVQNHLLRELSREVSR